MTQKPTRLAKKVLSDISESEAIESISCLLEILENKLDPDMTEIHIVTTLYKVQEQLKLLENHITKYIKPENDKLLGNKLAELYERQSAYGSSKLFED